MKAIAIKRGFHGNSMVERGASVEWPDGKKLPSWLREEKEAAVELAKPPVPLNADLKPLAAQKAVRTKAASAS